ncbi:hypothetical protein D3C76_1388940 [compost metagenome]
MPWCISGSIIDSRVVSWPPCRLAVEVNTPAGLPTSSPPSQRLLVPSRKYLSGAAMLPNRVGLPSTRPAQWRRSSSVAYSAPLAGISGATASHSVEIAGTVRRRASMPVSSIPRAMCRAISLVAPWRL